MSSLSAALFRAGLMPGPASDLGLGQRPEVANGVDMILTLLGAGMSGEGLLSDYDDLEPDDIWAALLFAARLSRVKQVHAVVS
ncbi:MAG: DUF433 domain-containing protein [Rhodococcus sp.]|nr:DUF433 domain-containing protein [Rhodococcus sp. (in: high G+C Gram-positive bacteria)]